jgi:hypothetical protein
VIRVRGKIALLLAVSMVLSTLTMVGIGYTVTPTIYVNPAITETNPGETFAIAISIMDAPPNVGAWQVSLTWNLDLTAFPPGGYEGPYLMMRGGPTSFFNVPDVLLQKMTVAGYVLSPTLPGAASGDLAYITFDVVASGLSDIDLFDSKLLDDSGNPIPHNLVDGAFATTKPFVDFTWTPDGADVGETITFDGSASYDPDGGSIVSYEWDFGDGDTDTGMMVTHAYADYADPWYVTLNCTDDEGEWWAATKELRVWREIVCGPIWYDPSQSLDYSLFENAVGGWALGHVAVANLGSIDLTFDLNVWAVHEESGYELALMPLWGNPVTVPAGGGLGFASLFLHIGLLEDEPGYYTFYAEADVFDNYMANNMATLRVRLGTCDLLMAKAETRHFKISDRGTTLTLEGKTKNTMKVATDPMGLYSWVRFEGVTPEGDPIMLDTEEALLYNEEESSKLSASLEVEPGTYSFTAYAVWSVLDYGETMYYGMDTPVSQKMKTFSVVVVP